MTDGYITVLGEHDQMRYLNGGNETEGIKRTLYYYQPMGRESLRRGIYTTHVDGIAQSGKPSRYSTAGLQKFNWQNLS